MPLSTSSLLMTYGSTFGTNTWGPVPTQPQEVTSRNSVINPTTTYVKKSDGLMSSGDSTTKDTMARLLRQTLEKTGSTIVSFAAVDNGEPESTGRSDGESGLTGRSEEAVVSELGGDFSAALKHAQSLLQQFGPLINGSDDTPITIRAHDQLNFSDKADGNDQSKGGNELDNRLEFCHTEDQLRGNLLEDVSEFAGADHDRRDEILGSDFEEEDTFSNIWAMRSSQRRSSEDSLDLTVEAAAESYVQPRTLNDVEVRDQANNESDAEVQQKENPEEGEEEVVISDTMFPDLRDAMSGNASIDIEKEYLENELKLTSAVDTRAESSHRQINASPNHKNGRKIEQQTEADLKEMTHENFGTSPKNRSSWKAAMQRREHRQREQLIHSSESDDSDSEQQISSRPQRRNQANRDKTSRCSDSSQRATAIPESGQQGGGAQSRITLSNTNDDRFQNSRIEMSLAAKTQAVPVDLEKRQEKRFDPPEKKKPDAERNGGNARTVPQAAGQNTVYPLLCFLGIYIVVSSDLMTLLS